MDFLGTYLPHTYIEQVIKNIKFLMQYAESPTIVVNLLR